MGVAIGAGCRDRTIPFARFAWLDFHFLSFSKFLGGNKFKSFIVIVLFLVLLLRSLHVLLTSCVWELFHLPT